MLYTSHHHVLITGANGNLGTKLTAHALSAGWCSAVTAVDLQQEAAAPAHSRLTRLAADLADPQQRPRWQPALQRVDTVWHLAAQHPYPDATWADAAASVDMTLHLVSAAQAAGVKRLVFASSNHVMGGYKDGPLLPGMLSAHTPPRPGTRFRQTAGAVFDSTPYAAAKLMNERICQAAAGAGLTTVCVRIGWCRPGDNRPEDIGLAVIPGVDAQQGADEQALQDLRWVRDMWLSNGDLAALFERCTLADSAAWPSQAEIVNGVSANRGSVWSLEDGRRWLGFEPQDDLYRHLAD